MSSSEQSTLSAAADTMAAKNADYDALVRQCHGTPVGLNKGTPESLELALQKIAAKAAA